MATTETNQTNAPEKDTGKPRPRLYVETYGCQMNEYDSDLVKTILSREKQYGLAKTPEEADLILLNTCAVRENAHSKIYARLRQLGSVRRRRGSLVGLLGCMAQNLAEDLGALNLPLDFIAGPDAYRQLPDLVDKASGQQKELNFAVEQNIRENYSDIVPMHQGNSVGAFLTIMRGCNNFCTFCVVPYTRGRERSRSVEEIIAEIHQLESLGKQEVTLLGQNVNSYQSEGNDFTRLVERILAETKIARVRFTSPHPKDFPEPLLRLMATEERFCSHIHLPLQAGNSEVLRRMKRNYNQEEFVDLALKMKDLIPGLSLTTDIITGFPGESEEQFEDTLKVCEAVRFDSAFMFKYSERQGTIAARRYPDDVPEAVKTRRLMRLVETQNKISAEVNKKYIGATERVLVEGESRRSADDLRGRSDNNKTVVFPREDRRAGEFVSVKILAATSATLRGKIVSDS